MIADLERLWDEVKARRGLRRFPRCSSKSCRTSGVYVCRGCGRPFCGHCGGHKISVDDRRVPLELRATCACHSCTNRKAIMDHDERVLSSDLPTGDQSRLEDCFTSITEDLDDALEGLTPTEARELCDRLAAHVAAMRETI